jgi:hypothetical protein
MEKKDIMQIQNSHTGKHTVKKHTCFYKKQISI